MQSQPCILEIVTTKNIVSAGPRPRWDTSYIGRIISSGMRSIRLIATDELPASTAK